LAAVHVVSHEEITGRFI
jgi:hypothetical protein